MDFTFEDPHVRDHIRRVHELSRDLDLIKQLKAPGLTTILEAPVIEGWMLGSRAEPALIGSVSGHPLLPDGPVITSTLHYLDPVAKYARTLTRWYRLGTPG